MKKKFMAIGYVRTATENQSALSEQRREIELFCTKNNLFLVRIFEDNGASGMKFDKSGWKLLRRFLEKNHDIKKLIVPTFEHISRDIFEVLAELKILKTQYGVRALSVKGVDMLKEFEFKKTRLRKGKHLK